MAPSRSHHPRNTTSSPSSRKRRVSPLRQRERLGSAPGQLEQTSARLARGPRHRAGAEQIARPQIAAVAGVMRHHLPEGPVEVSQVRSADDVRGFAQLRASARSRARPRAADRSRRAHARCSASRYGSGAGSPCGPRERRRAKRLERVERDHPRRDRRREALGEKRTERLVFPRLDVARRPVVQQAHAEHVLLGLVDRDRRRRARSRGR